MIKNTTLRSLALGAIAAMAATGLVTTPANAVGLEGNFVSLAPATGTEFSVLAGTGATFKLTANEASTLVTGDLKFLVTDTSGVIEPGFDTSGRLAFTTAVASTSLSATAGVVGIQATGITTAVGAGSLIKFGADLANAAATVATAIGKVFPVQATSSANILNFTGGIATTVAISSVSAAVAISVVREARDTTKNQYIVDTGNSETTTSSTLQLVSPDTESRTVTVVAWKDANDDNKIDVTEYVSATRTISFVKPSTLTTTTELTVVPGDETLSATIKTVPVLNGNQVLSHNSSAINVGFTRQDSTIAEMFGIATTATWNDTTKAFTVAVSNQTAANVGWTTVAGTADAQWTGLTKAAARDNVQSLATKTSGSATATIQLASGQNPHNLRVGDSVTFDATDAPVGLIAARLAVSAITASNSFQVVTATASGLIASTGSAYTVTTYNTGDTANKNTFQDRAFAGTHTARAYIQGAASGARVTAGAVSATSNDLTFTTVASANVQGASDVDTATVLIKQGTLTVPVLITVYDDSTVPVAVSAGRPVVVSVTGAGITVNAKTGAQTLMTDAKGQVALTVTSAAGALGSAVITATAENLASDVLTMTWTAQAYGLIDFTGTGNSALDATVTRTITTGGTYTLNLAVMDQWFAPAADASYRLVVTGSGTVEGVKALSAGRATVTIADNGFQTALATTITLQRDMSGTWTRQGAWVVTTNLRTAAAIILGANGTSLYGVTVDTADSVSAKALVELDKRLTTTAVPNYANDVVLAGQVRDAGTSAAFAGAEVVVTGPSNILFFDGNVYKRGTITMQSDASGNFNVKLYSTTAQTDTVITFASLGKTATVKVSFSGIGIGEGTSLVITAPDFVAPASTLQVKAKLSDVFGNGVEAAANRIRMTYTGAGIGFGTLPNSTDKNGELAYSVLLGAGDTGTITVVVSYDQNGDGDFVDAKDLNTTKTITVGTAAAPVVPVADQKVNVGSFKGFVALYAKGYAGQKMSAIVAGKWIVVPALGSGFERVVRFTGAGFNIDVKIYIDTVLTGTFSVLTK